jgi:lambda repressor-like predicted transcriptional regulator
MDTLVKARCREIGVSQSQLSHKTGLHYSTCNAICTGRLNPNPRQCRLIAEVLKTTPAELWPGLIKEEAN